MSVSVHMTLEGDLDKPASRTVAEKIVSDVEAILKQAASSVDIIELKTEMRHFPGSEDYRNVGCRVELYGSYHLEDPPNEGSVRS